MQLRAALEGFPSRLSLRQAPQPQPSLHQGGWCPRSDAPLRRLVRSRSRAGHGAASAESSSVNSLAEYGGISLFRQAAISKRKLFNPKKRRGTLTVVADDPMVALLR